MNFEELQKEWQSMKIEHRNYSHDELRAMMYNDSREVYMRRVSWYEMRRFFLSVALTVLSPVFDLFCLFTPPVGVALDEIEDEHMGTRYLRMIPPKDRPRAPLTAAFATMKLVLFVARLMHTCLWVALVLILIAPMALEHGITAAFVIALVPVVLVVTWFRSRRWLLKGKNVSEVLKELNDQVGSLRQRP